MLAAVAHRLVAPHIYTLAVVQHFHAVGNNNDILRGQRNFLVLDPDGYLLRFAQKLGTKSVEELGNGV